MHGGRREGAGRPNRTGKPGHSRRPVLEKRHPVHVTLKLTKGLPNIRRKDTFKLLRKSVAKARTRGFSVAHFAILSNHLHLIIEPQGVSLRRPMQSLLISFAKRLNAQLDRRGEVFHGRYHLHVLKTVRETRNALAYVLTNESRHKQKRAGIKSSRYEVRIDLFSSAYIFEEWDALFPRGKPDFSFSGWTETAIFDWYALFVVPARTWLLTQGWRLPRAQPAVRTLA